MQVADAGAETATEHSTPVLITQLKSLEKNGTEVYTQYIFKFFQDEIQHAFALIVARHVDTVERRLYFIEMYSHPESNWTIEYYPIDSRINCSCLMFESFCLPCCHMIVVMKYEHLSSIPPSLVMQRWTRSGQPPAQQQNVGQISRSISHTARYEILSSGYKLMSFYASHAQNSFKDARQVEHEMTSWMRKRWEMGKNKEFDVVFVELYNLRPQMYEHYPETLFVDVHLPMTAVKRKIPSLTPPPLRRSKRLAECKDAPILVDQSTNEGGDEEMNVNSGGDSDEEIIYNGFKPDNPSMWWDTIYDAWTNDHPIASLPLAHLLTGFIHDRRKLPNLMQDKWGKVQISVMGSGTIGKSEGQSKLHQEVNNPASLKGLRDMILTV
ncbi:hypothetical protein RHGRI_020966 [Rhododendron griersonianum]|uniref:Protein FAR1-RELATED SEQUENCE n=1 Tax=Rhododendron griersonianum TaxID=479676 RepID=A0AAV6JNK3_9ERIC|nr:hypothetical protein RHGRI_020966 [Rhododendron griersonianum]